MGGCSSDRSTTTPIGDRLDEDFRNLVDDVPPMILEEDELPKEPVEGEEAEEEAPGGSGGGEGKAEKTSVKSLKFAAEVSSASQAAGKAEDGEGKAVTEDGTVSRMMKE